MATAIAVVGAVSVVAGAITGRKQAKIASGQADISAQQVELQREQVQLQKSQLLEERNRARQEAVDNEVRRTATLAERELERRFTRVRANVLETRQIRESINAARIQQAEQIAAGASAGFAGAAGAIAADLGAAIGGSRTAGALDILVQQSQLRQQDIQNRLIDVETLPGFRQAPRDVLFTGGSFIGQLTPAQRSQIPDTVAAGAKLFTSTSPGNRRTQARRAQGR